MSYLADGPFQVPWSDYTPTLWHALIKTIEYTVVSFIGAAILGLAVALLRLSKLRVLRIIATIYTELFKNIPLLAIIFVTYYGLTSVNITLTVFEAGSLSLIVFYAAYLSEIFRAAISGVHAVNRRRQRRSGSGGWPPSCMSSSRRRCGWRCQAPTPWRSTCSSRRLCWS